MVPTRVGTGFEVSGLGRARVLRINTESGSGFWKQGFQAQISLAYYIIIQLSATFKF